MSRWKWAVTVVVVLLAFAWNAGTFDHALVNVGMNRNDCGRNGFGATFCGDQLTDYRQRLEDAQQEADRAQQAADEELQRLEDDAAEEQRKAEQEVARQDAYVRQVEACLAAGRTNCTYGE